MSWMLVSSYKRYRKELRWNATFTVRAQVIYIGSDSFFMEYKFLKNDFVHCHVIDKFVIVHKDGKVSPQNLFPWADDSLFTPPPHVADLIETDEEFQRQVRKV